MSESKFPFRGQGHYNFIITGAGCAGLSLLIHMIDSGKFADRSILLVDKEEKIKSYLEESDKLKLMIKDRNDERIATQRTLNRRYKSWY